ncbi:hypothetical protein [Aquimarina sp. RZ0]|uniref:hypothetical protein n=1 Tax=Aquimarina sp. RZ0 TaxID=2607730 RepID=UPI0011F2E425|nr:hypothetical protein [Aquimarina sp. RZ0]KAA1246795.1 hypothetical protein F0000_05920 [Aquimarina sp. RZ0]
MITFVENQTTLGIIPTFGKVTYHQKIFSEVLCYSQVQQQTLEKEIQVEVLPYNPMFFTLKIVTKHINIKLDSVLKKQEDLLQEVYGIMDTVQFRMNWRGELIEILNHQEILNKWSVLKPKLKQKYTGQAIERYLLGIERKIQNHNKLLSDCLQYRLYGLLFNEMYGTHSSDAEFTKDRERLLSNMVYQLPLAIREKVLLENEGEEKTILNVFGTLDQEQQYATKIQNLFKRKNILDPNGIKLENYKGTYRYDKKTGIFDAVVLDVVTTYGTDYKKNQNYRLTQEA